MLNSPAVALASLAVDVAPAMSPEQFADYVRGEHARYARLIPELGIKTQ